MIGLEGISLPLAFAAGLLSFISPCVLPLVPVYLGYLTGSTVSMTGEAPPRRNVFGHALLFVCGFTLVFVFAFGAPAGVIGLSRTATGLLVRVGGVFLIIFGLHLAGGFHLIARAARRLPALERPLAWWANKLDELILPERRLRLGADQSPGFTRSLFIGMTFAAGWTPCIGPLLGAIITLAASGQDFFRSILLLFIYSMGLAIPFLAAALLFTNAAGLLRRLNRHARTIEMVSSVFLVTIGVLLLSDAFARLNQYFSVTPEYLQDIELKLLEWSL